VVHKKLGDVYCCHANVLYTHRVGIITRNEFTRYPLGKKNKNKLKVPAVEVHLRHGVEGRNVQFVSPIPMLNFNIKVAFPICSGILIPMFR